MLNGKNFFDCYGKHFASGERTKVIEIGAQDVNGTLRSVCPTGFEYIGVDFVAGKGVDVVLTDPYSLPFGDEEADIVVSSSCLEHSEMFWLVFLEIMRVLKPRGIFYLNVPSNGTFHRYPVDCWRFYPDSGNALVSWARRNNINATLLESFTSAQVNDVWNDFVAVFLKDQHYTNEFKDRVTDKFTDFSNGIIAGKNEFLKPSPMTEDQKKISVISQIVNNMIKL